MNELKELISYEDFQKRIQEVFSLPEGRSKYLETTSTTLQVCDGENCFGKDRNKYLRHFLMNRLMDTGKYKKIGIECVTCLGHCENGPNVMVKDSDLIVHHVDTATLDRLVNTLGDENT